MAYFRAALVALVASIFVACGDTEGSGGSGGGSGGASACSGKEATIYQVNQDPAAMGGPIGTKTPVSLNSGSLCNGQNTPLPTIWSVLRGRT